MSSQIRDDVLAGKEREGEQVGLLAHELLCSRTQRFLMNKWLLTYWLGIDRLQLKDSIIFAVGHTKCHSKDASLRGA